MSDETEVKNEAGAAPEEEPRVGVFVCDCGSNIQGAVRCNEVRDFAEGLPDVVAAEEGKWICSVDFLNRMKESVTENNLNRVVVACCTPRTHEKLFRKTVAEAGMNPYQLEFVSTREQVSWVHRNDQDVATEKAKDLVKMGVAKARLLEPGYEIKLPVGRSCLIIGGGAAGMTAATAIANQGFQVYLVEREAELGGLLNSIGTIAPEGNSAAEVKEALLAEIASRDNIKVFTNAKLTKVEGYIGNYSVAVEANGETEEFHADTVIVATGMVEIDCTGQYMYGESPDVVTQLQLEGMLQAGEVKDKKNVVFIQCVNSRNEERGCCTVGCGASVKNARAIKEAQPDTNVYVLYRDMITVKEEYVHLKEVMKEGVVFVRWEYERPPVVTETDDGLAVTVYNILLGQEITLPADLVVLATGFQGADGVEDIKGLLKVSANSDGFFQEQHIKLGPLDFAAAGVHLAGSARNPKPMKDVRDEGYGAAMRASIPMTAGFVEAEGIVAKIDLTNCIECGLCAKKCPYGAIKLVGEEGKTPEVISALCKGCGTCAADCPKECIQIVHYTDEQLLAAVDAALEHDADKKIIAFVCHWCAHGAVDIAGVGRMEYPPNIRIIRVMCSARVAQRFVQHALDKGAAGVLVAGCEFPTCHYITGNYECKDRLEKLRRKLGKKGYDTDKIWEVWLSAAMGPKWVSTQKEMVKALGLENKPI
ncbi:MAG: hydrogenase iron-sulfur subunit [Actinobacteria bacterium]|nr:hydrogenase iron-sulfur subunit [Actinomycetota bacterium]